jgi:hypothetical protein
MTDGKPTWVSLGSLTLKPGCQGQGGEEATRLTRAGLTPSQILSSPEINFFVFFFKKKKTGTKKNQALSDVGMWAGWCFSYRALAQPRHTARWWVFCTVLDHVLTTCSIMELPQ